MLINERMTWEEIVKKYPDRWVALTDCKMDGPDIIEGLVLCVCEEKDMDSAEIEIMNNKIPFMWERTTELEGFLGVCIM